MTFGGSGELNLFDRSQIETGTARKDHIELLRLLSLHRPAMEGDNEPARLSLIVLVDISAGLSSFHHACVMQEEVRAFQNHVSESYRLTELHNSALNPGVTGICC